MGFRGSSGTSHKTRKSKGRRTLSQFKTVGKTWACPVCHNVNSQPVCNHEGKAYCSSCLAKTSQVIFMKVRNIVQRK